MEFRIDGRRVTFEKIQPPWDVLAIVLGETPEAEIDAAVRSAKREGEGIVIVGEEGRKS